MAADSTSAEASAVCAFCGNAMSAHAEPVETKIVGDELLVKCVLQPEGYARSVQQSVSVGTQNDNGTN